MADDNFYESDEAPGSFNFYKGHEQAISDITIERLRQVGAEGWTPGHDDDEHRRGELSAAAACYALAASDRESTILGSTRFSAMPPQAWPWDLKWWKLSNSRRELVKAGALIIAEIERLDRETAKC